MNKDSILLECYKIWCSCWSAAHMKDGFKVIQQETTIYCGVIPLVRYVCVCVRLWILLQLQNRLGPQSPGVYTSSISKRWRDEDERGGSRGREKMNRKKKKRDRRAQKNGGQGRKMKASWFNLQAPYKRLRQVSCLKWEVGRRMWRKRKREKCGEWGTEVVVEGGNVHRSSLFFPLFLSLSHTHTFLLLSFPKL